MNDHGWRRYFSWRRLRFFERRNVGGTAHIDDPKGIGLAGDLGSGWEYRPCR